MMYDIPTYGKFIVFHCTFGHSFCFYLVQPTSVPPISDLGPDALEEPMNLDDFFSSLNTKKIGIKALLLDQVGLYWFVIFVLYLVRLDYS